MIMSVFMKTNRLFLLQDVDNILVIENGVGNQARFSFASFQFVGQVTNKKIEISKYYMAHIMRHMLCDVYQK